MSRTRLARKFGVVLVTGFAAISVAGCESASGIFGAEAPSASATAPAATVPGERKRVAFAPIIGAPSDVATAMQTKLTSALAAQQVPVVSAADKPDYTVRGYVVAAPHTNGTELSYIWDLLDAKDQRVHRISEKEIIQGERSSDPWKNVKPASIDAIAAKTATQLAGVIPQPTPAQPAATTPAGQTPVAQAARPAAPTQLAATPAKPTTPVIPAAATPTTPTVSNASLGSSSRVTAVVPPIAGAPGDGSTSLSAALQRQLATRGVAPSANPATDYKVQGRVDLSQPTAGKQEIRIVWQVIDPKGRKVGTVSQKNSIPQGSLDGAWGRTADAAAEAAVKGVLRLMPKEQASAN